MAVSGASCSLSHHPAEAEAAAEPRVSVSRNRAPARDDCTDALRRQAARARLPRTYGATVKVPGETSTFSRTTDIVPQRSPSHHRET